MIRWMKWIGILAAILLAASCFLPWVLIESKGITVTGMDSTGTNFGKPGYLHLILAVLFLICLFAGKVWALRSNLLVTGLNLGWAIRNYFIVSQCRGGECPEKQLGIYLMIFASLLMIAGALFPKPSPGRLS